MKQDTLKGTASIEVPTTFMGLIGVAAVEFVVSAQAKALSEPPPCFNVLDPDKWYGLRLRDSINFAGSKCETHVHSTREDSSAGFEGSSNIVFDRVCLAGGADTPILNKEENCDVAPDSFAGHMPSVTVGSCTYTDQSFNQSAVTLSPGVYCGATSISAGVADLTLNPGLYIISGGTFSIAAQNVTGNGVTFYFADSGATIEMDGVNSATLEAPASGTYKDILMFQQTGLGDATVTFNATSNQNWQGIIHTPSWDYRIQNASNWELDINMVAWSIEIDDAANWTIAPHVLTAPASGAQLVEVP